MILLHRLASVLRWMIKRRKAEAELDDELRTFVEMAAADRMRDGAAPPEARRLALLELGGAEQVKEGVRTGRHGGWLDEFGRDLRYGFRQIRRSPGFAITAIVSLALGIGANAAIFNALYVVLWQPLPVSKPEELVKVSIAIGSSGQRDVPTVALVRQLAGARVFDSIAVTSADGFSFSDHDRAERVLGEVVSGNYFDLLGVQSVVGQPFTKEVRMGRWAAEVVLSYGFWQRRFRSDPSVIGRTVQLNTYPFTIAGVSPPGFHGLERGTDIDVRIPMLPEGLELAQIARISARPDRALFTVARLRPGFSLEQTTASADAQLQEFLRTTTIQRFRDRGRQQMTLVAVGRGDSALLRQLHTPLYILFVLVGLVLLIACANVANMLLARAATRARELAVRMAIGAGRFRLLRQILAESLLLSLLAGMLAVVIGHWVAGTLVHFLPQGHVTTVVDLRLNVPTVLFVFVLSVVACVTCGLAPAVHTTRFNLVAMLKPTPGASIGTLPSAWVRKLLVMSQVAFSLVLLIAAGIFVRTMLTLWPMDYGAHPERVLLITMKPQPEIYTPVQRRALIAELVRRVAAIPGVDATGVAEYGPLGSRISERRESIEAAPGHPIRVETDWASEGFFTAVGIPQIAGRGFSRTDMVGSAPVVVINQTLARELFGHASPVGRRIRLAQAKDARPLEIIGVVGDSRYYEVHGSPQPAVWFAFQDKAPEMPTLHVRSTHANIDALAAAVRLELNGLDKGFPIFNVKTLETRIEESLARERILASLSGAVGLLALALAGVGLYGILAYSVSRRTREVGIRMALGSSVRSVLWSVTREALVLLGAGSLVGVTLSLAAWQMVSARMPDVSPIDGHVLGVCAAIMLILAVAAVSIPAIRACRIDPLTALRHE